MYDILWVMVFFTFALLWIRMGTVNHFVSENVIILDFPICLMNVLFIFNAFSDRVLLMRNT